jgi:hypothetical protein
MMWDILQGRKYREIRCVVADPSIAYSIRCVGRLLSVDTAAFYNDSGPWDFDDSEMMTFRAFGRKGVRGKWSEGWGRWGSYVEMPSSEITIAVWPGLGLF